MMSQQIYQIRNYRPSDFDGYVNLHISAEKIDPSGRCISRQILQEYLQRPLYDPVKDLFIAEAAGEIVGFLNITSELVACRVLLDCLVHPEHRQKGLARLLLERAIQRTRQLQVSTMHANVMEDNVAARKALSRLGFSEIREFLEMNLPINDLELPNTPNNKFVRRHLQRGEEGRLAELQNRCFADTWGFNPNTPEEIAYALSLSGASVKDVVILYDHDQPVGYCWTKIDCQKGGKQGRILMLGVDPAHRGRGIGKLAVWAGLSSLKDKGVEVVELTVDSENQAAYSLYKSSGFRVLARSLYYEKRID